RAGPGQRPRPDPGGRADRKPGCRQRDARARPPRTGPSRAGLHAAGRDPQRGGRGARRAAPSFGQRTAPGMNWIDALTLASRSLRRRPGRALLTILSVTLGTTLLVALASVAASAGSRIVSKLSNGGPATAIKVSASKANSDQAYTDDVRVAGPKAINDAPLGAVRQSP